MFANIARRVAAGGRLFSCGTLIGKEAPAFAGMASMPDNLQKKVSASDYRGKYLALYFYPADFTFVCATEAIDFHKLHDEFAKRNCAVVGCSTDTAHTHRAWKATEKSNGGLGTAINHPLLADVTKSISRDYGVLLDNGLACRGVFIIDRQGNVRAEMKNDLSLGRNVHEVLRVLDAVIYTDLHGGEACPSGWTPGKPAMETTLTGLKEYLTKHT